jgi:hypothetical protein
MIQTHSRDASTCTAIMGRIALQAQKKRNSTVGDFLGAEDRLANWMRSIALDVAEN